MLESYKELQTYVDNLQHLCHNHTVNVVNLAKNTSELNLSESDVDKQIAKIGTKLSKDLFFIVQKAYSLGYNDLLKDIANKK